MERLFSSNWKRVFVKFWICKIVVEISCIRICKIVVKQIWICKVVVHWIKSSIFMILFRMIYFCIKNTSCQRCAFQKVLENLTLDHRSWFIFTTILHIPQRSRLTTILHIPVFTYSCVNKELLKKKLVEGTLVVEVAYTK